jgi:L-malate glycosyltransferase
MNLSDRLGFVAPIDLTRLPTLLGVEVDQALPPGRTGAASVTTVMAASLAEHVPLHVVTDDTTIDQPWRTQIGPHIVTVVPARPHGFARDVHRLERRGLRRAIAEVPVRLLHAHWTYEYALAALRFRKQVPVIVSLHDWAPALMRLRPHPYNVLRLGMLASAVPRASALTANSPYLVRRLRRVGFAADLIANPVPESAFDWRPRLREQPAVLLAVNVGFDRRKNMQTLLRAFTRVRARLPGSQLRLAGRPYGPGEDAEAWARRHHLAEGVQFLGVLDPARVRSEMRDATLFVHPSREETFGQVLVEALAVGTPVLAGEDSGAVPWVLAEGRAGHLVDVNDVVALAEGILVALEDPQLDERGERGRQLTWDRFSAARITSRLLELYGRHGLG